MNKVKYMVVNTDDGVDIRVEDGGVSYIYQATCLSTIYHQDRTKDIDIDWDELSEGKAYYKDWCDKEEIDEEMIQDALEWLYVSTEEFKFVKVESIEELFR